MHSSTTSCTDDQEQERTDALMNSLSDCLDVHIQSQCAITLQVCFEKMICLGPAYYAKHSLFRNVCCSKILELEDHPKMTPECHAVLLQFVNVIVDSFSCATFEWSCEDDAYLDALLEISEAEETSEAPLEEAT